MHLRAVRKMQAGGPDSAAVSEAPSSGSEESDCETQAEPDADAALTEEWARELLEDAGVASPHEVLTKKTIFQI